MPEPKRTAKPRRAKPRARRRKPSQPPVIEPMPKLKEAYYSGLGLIDWAAERAARLPAKLRRFEKELVARGLKRDAVLTEQLEEAREEFNRRGREFHGRARRTIQEVWAALQGSNRSESTGTSATPGTL